MSAVHSLRPFGPALRVLVFLIAFGLPLGTLAQGSTVRGRLLDEKDRPVPFANVALIGADSTKPAAIRLSDSTGAFSVDLPEGDRFYLRITAIGFSVRKTEVFGSGTDLGTIRLQAETKALNDVTVTAMRPTIVQKPDRMVVSVEGTAMAAGNNAYSVLAKSPGVFIDPEGNIQLNGRAGVTVMIDGRPTFLSARDLRNLLEGMSAENIKNIEIITTPSAKYEAEGTSGILNINLKKNTRRGVNGNVNASYNYNFQQQHGFSYGTNINFKGGRWSSSLNVDAARRVGGRDATFTRVFYGTNKVTYFDQKAIGNYSVYGPPFVRLATDYSINDRHSVGVVANYGTNYFKEYFLTDTYIGSAPNSPSQYIDADNINRNRFTNYTTNLHYTGKLDTSGTTLSVDLDWVKIKNAGGSDFNNYYWQLPAIMPQADILATDTRNGYTIRSARADFSKPLTTKQKMELGFRVSEVSSDNDFRFYFNNNGQVIDPRRSNHFLYDENIYAGYLNWNGSFGKYQVQAGLRGEQTRSLGTQLTTGERTRRNYLNLFPTIFVQRDLTDQYAVSFSYGRRISRPNYGSLNPFRSYRDPYTYFQGNPYLRPMYTHSFALIQTFRKVYIVNINYQYLRDVISEIPILRVEDTTTIYTTGNVNDVHSISMTSVIPVKITKKWDVQNTLLLYYNTYSMPSEFGQLSTRQFTVSIQSNHTILLPKDFRMEISAQYRSPRVSGLYHMASLSRVDFGLRRSIMKKKIDLTLNVNDIFKGYRYLWTTDIGGQVNEFDQYFRWRTVGFTIRYNFSKGQKVDVKKRNAVDEVNRAN